MQPEHVLIIDDNPINLRLVQVVLEIHGFTVELAQDAEEALTKLAGFHPDVILMDLQLPGMDGLELTRRLKMAPETSDIVIIAVTSYAMKGDHERALDAGCDDYVSKPIDTEALPEIIRRFEVPSRRSA